MGNHPGNEDPLMDHPQAYLNNMKALSKVLLYQPSHFTARPAHQSAIFRCKCTV